MVIFAGILQLRPEMSTMVIFFLTGYSWVYDILEYKTMIFAMIQWKITIIKSWIIYTHFGGWPSIHS